MDGAELRRRGAGLEVGVGAASSAQGSSAKKSVVRKASFRLEARLNKGYFLSQPQSQLDLHGLG